MSDPGPKLAGFQKQIEFEKITHWKDFVTTLYGLATTGACIVLAGIGVYLAPTGVFKINSTLHSASRFSPIVTSLIGLGIIFLALGILAVGHEGLHWSVLRYFGYDPKIEFLNLKTVVTEEMMDRNHHIVCLLAPLLVLSPVAYLAAALSPTWELSMLFSLVFQLNLLGSGLDVLDTVSAFRDPTGTKYWAEYAGGELVGVRYSPIETD